MPLLWGDLFYPHLRDEGGEILSKDQVVMCLFGVIYYIIIIQKYFRLRAESGGRGQARERGDCKAGHAGHIPTEHSRSSWTELRQVLRIR